MATETYTGNIGEIRAASTAGGGTALTTSLATIGLPEGSRWVSLTPRNFATGVVAQFSFNPYLLIIKTTDALATSGNLTDFSSAAQDADAGTDVVLSSLDTAANDDFLYVGSHLPFRGVAVDVDAANGNSSILTVKYWNGSAWTDSMDVDGTIDTGKTMAVDGNVTWAIPSDWVADSLLNIGDASNAIGIHVSEPNIYWTRWEVSLALDSSVTLNSMRALNRATTYGELLSGQAFEESITMGPGGIGCIEAKMNAGTGNLVVNVATRSASARFI